MNSRKFQGGLSNEELAAAFSKKLPGVTPTDRELSAFALGIEVGESLCREANDARSAFNAAIDFAIELGDYEGMGFLKLWREGDWEVIAGEFPDFDLSTTGFR